MEAIYADSLPSFGWNFEDKADTFSGTNGVVGTASMACAVFALIAGLLPLGIVLAVDGFLGWIAPYPLYTKLRKKKTQSVAPQIDAQYDDIYGVCEKANALLLS